MKNNLMTLNNYLFEEMERLLDDSLSGQELETEMQRAGAISKVAETIIKNGELSLKTVAYMNDGRANGESTAQWRIDTIPQNLISK